MGRIIEMEDYFACGFNTKPLIHVGSQNLRFWNGSPQEQAHEGFHLVAALDGDLGVARNVDPQYLDYWNRLTQTSGIISLDETNDGSYLSERLLNSENNLATVKNKLTTDFYLLPFIITHMEENLAEKLGIRIMGNINISNTYGTKDGIRILAKNKRITMPPGFICDSRKSVINAIAQLSKKYKKIIIKHPHSASGYLSKYMSTGETLDIQKFLSEVCGHTYTDGTIVVVEAWIKNKASLCSQIEITENHEVIICAGWQQIIDTDGITYIGAGPLNLSEKALHSFIQESQAIGEFLRDAGAVGIFGPDFLISSNENEEFEEDTCILLELNARAPVTSYPLQAIKCIKGKIGSGFCSTGIKLKTPSSFEQIKIELEAKKLLITSRTGVCNGVVVFNPTMIPYGKFDIIAISNDFDETMHIVRRVKKLFE
jgi:hypothetical protein